MESRRHPMDFQALKKGDVITREEVLAAVGRQTVGPGGEEEPAYADYRLLALRLAAMIEDERDDLLTRMSGDNIVIMGDLEADHVTYARGKRAVRSLARNAQRRTVIDRSEFTAEQVREAETRDRQMTALALLGQKELQRRERDALLSGGRAEPRDDGEETDLG